MSHASIIPAILLLLAALLLIPVRVTTEVKLRSGITLISVRISFLLGLVSIPICIVAEYHNIMHVTIVRIARNGAELPILHKRKQKPKNRKSLRLFRLVMALLRGHASWLLMRRLTLSGTLSQSSQPSAYMLCGAVNGLFCSAAYTLFGSDTPIVWSRVQPSGNNSKLILNLTCIFFLSPPNIIRIILKSIVGGNK